MLIALNSIQDLILKWTHIHPLKLLFYLTLILLLFGIIGFLGIRDWKSAFRSIFTVGFSLVIFFFLTYILYVGNID